jgi:hypothetical protein
MEKGPLGPSNIVLEVNMFTEDADEELSRIDPTTELTVIGGGFSFPYKRYVQVSLRA